MNSNIGASLRELSTKELQDKYGAGDMQPEKRTSIVCITVSAAISAGVGGWY